MCDWPVEKHRKRLERMLDAEFVEGSTPVIDRAIAQLDEYFAGSRRRFDIPLLLVGTPFQKSVWTELLAIPYGSTISYAELARRIGRPTAVRAVANSNGANALSIFVPCHRVIGADCSLTGYAGGLLAKNYLLNLENSFC